MGSGTYWKGMLVGALYWGVCSVVGLRDACPPGAERGCKQRHISLTDRGVSIVPAPDNVVAPLQVLMRDAMVRAADIVVVFHFQGISAPSFQSCCHPVRSRHDRGWTHLKADRPTSSNASSPRARGSRAFAVSAAFALDVGAEPGSEETGRRPRDLPQLRRVLLLTLDARWDILCLDDPDIIRARLPGPRLGTGRCAHARDVLLVQTLHPRRTCLRVVETVTTGKSNVRLINIHLDGRTFIHLLRHISIPPLYSTSTHPPLPLPLPIPIHIPRNNMLHNLINQLLRDPSRAVLGNQLRRRVFSKLRGNLALDLVQQGDVVPDQVPVGLDDLVDKLVILLGERVLPELRALLAELGLLVAEEVADVDHFSG